jgi:hypothetical protein
MLFQNLLLNKTQIDDILKNTREEIVGYNSEEVEKEKMNKCPLYHLIYYPNVEYILENDQKCSYINRVIFTLLQKCEQRIGVFSLKENRIKTLLYSNDLKNNKLKLIIIILLTKLDNFLFDVLKSLYKKECKEELSHFELIMPYLQNQALLLLFDGYNIYNIKWTIDDFFYNEIIMTYNCGIPKIVNK